MAMQNGGCTMNDPSNQKKVNKGKSYTLAFDRIGMAIKAKFPVEAIALEESIVSDRLRSFLKEAMPILMKDKSFDASTLVSYATLYISPQEDTLLVEIRDWIRKRNNVIHGVVASRSGKDATIPAERFVSNAMSVARKGEKLAHQLSHWVDREKRKLKRHKCQQPDNSLGDA